MTPDELREKVRQEFADMGSRIFLMCGDGCENDCPCRDAADRAIALVLKEAAHVADENACDCCFYIAAAIRALMPKGNA